MKHINKYYEEWSGENRLSNDCHPVHDSSECIDFAECYYREKSEPLISMLKKILAIENNAFTLKGFDVNRLKNEINESLKK